MIRSRFHRAIFPALVLSLFALAPINAAAQTEQDVEKAAETLERAEATKSAAYQRWLDARERLDAAVARYEEVNAEREALTYTIAQLYDRISEYEGNVIDLNGLKPHRRSCFRCLRAARKRSWHWPRLIRIF